MRAARQQGIKVGLLRPITVSPFPFEVIEQLAGRVSAFLVTEMNSGQMLEDVRLAVKGRAPIEFYGRMGGVVPLPDELLREIVTEYTREAGVRSLEREIGSVCRKVAREFAEGVHAKFPGKPLMYNCSPSFNWSKNLSEADIARSYELHANCFVSKPGDFGEFINAVRSLEAFWLKTVKLPPR